LFDESKLGKMPAMIPEACPEACPAAKKDFCWSLAPALSPYQCCELGLRLSNAAFNSLEMSPKLFLLTKRWSNVYHYYHRR
jgi:hypothetical protein